MIPEIPLLRTYVADERVTARRENLSADARVPDQAQTLLRSRDFIFWRQLLGVVQIL